MPALIPTALTARVVWLGYQPVPVEKLVITSVPLTEMPLSFAGFEGEVHAGVTRPSCGRVLKQYPRGTEIRNVRQLCVVSAEEMAEVAAGMGIPAMDYAWVGASVVIEGIPDFSHIPPSSRLQAEGGATLVVDMENRPCTLPAKPIEATHPGKGRAFKPAAAGRRGITAWVEREGTLHVGETVRLHVPDQPVWAHLDAARRG